MNQGGGSCEHIVVVFHFGWNENEYLVAGGIDDHQSLTFRTELYSCALCKFIYRMTHVPNYTIDAYSFMLMIPTEEYTVGEVEVWNTDRCRAEEESSDTQSTP